MSLVYTNADKLIKDGSLDLANDTLKWMLVDDTYVANADDVNVSAASSAELSGTGYAGGFAGAGRKTATGIAVAVDNANNRTTVAVSNPSAWTGIDAGTAHAAILIKEVTDDTDSILVAYLDGASDYVTNGGDLNLAVGNGFIFTTTIG